MRHVWTALLLFRFFTLAATLASLAAPARAVVLSHGDCLKGDAMVIHAVNAEKHCTETARAGRPTLDAQSPPFLGHAGAIAGSSADCGTATYVAVSSRVATELHQYFGVPKGAYPNYSEWD